YSDKHPSSSWFAGNFLTWIIYQQYLIVLLATPAFTAGGITDEKTRGTLLYLFSADLSSWEILVGKLWGRTFEVVVLLMTTLPCLCFVGIWAGISLPGVLALCLTLLGPVFAVGAASLVMSVWCRRTSDAVIGLYAILGPFVLLWAGLTWLGGLPPWLDGMK